MALMTTPKPSKNNLYYPVFRNIESEVIKLSQGIYFSDEQLKVYSIKISELLSRCLTEIESLYKELYRKEAGSDPGKVGDAWTFLDAQWKLSKKQLGVASDNFFFDKSFHPYFAPFDYKNKSEDDFYSAYNAVKHDRAKNLNKANLNVLIRALGALYILNIYYSDKHLASTVFEAKIAGRATGVFMDLGLDLGDFMDTCLFIEYLEYDYYFWQEDNSEKCRKMLGELAKADMGKFKTTLINNSSEIFYITNQLLELHDSNTSVGEILKTSHSIAKPLVDGEITEVVNIGYESVYLSTTELGQLMSEIDSKKKVVALENLKKSALTAKSTKP